MILNLNNITTMVVSPIMTISSRTDYLSKNLRNIPYLERTNADRIRALKMNVSSACTSLSASEFDQEVIDACFPYFNKNERYKKLSILAKGFVALERGKLYSLPVSDEIPVIKELKNFGYLTYPGLDWITLFDYCSQEFIEKEVYPYLVDHISLTLTNIISLGNILYNLHKNYLAVMILEDCLKFMEDLTIYKRRKYINLLIKTIDANRGWVVSLDEILKNLISRFPELRLKYL